MMAPDDDHRTRPRRPRQRRSFRVPVVLAAVGMAGGGVNLLFFQDPAAYAFFGTPVAGAIAMFADEARRRDEATA